MTPTSIVSSRKFFCGIATSMMRAVMKPGIKPSSAEMTMQPKTTDCSHQ